MPPTVCYQSGEPIGPNSCVFVTSFLKQFSVLFPRVGHYRGHPGVQGRAVTSSSASRVPLSVEVGDQIQSRVYHRRPTRRPRNSPDNLASLSTCRGTPMDWAASGSVRANRPGGQSRRPRISRTTLSSTGRRSAGSSWIVVVMVNGRSLCSWAGDHSMAALTPPEVEPSPEDRPSTVQRCKPFSGQRGS